MSILMLNGSPRKGETYKVMRSMKERLQDLGNDCEMINLSDYNIAPCKGCYSCFLQGEGCQIKDDVSMLWDKMQNCSALVIASPVFAMGVTGTMKNFLDRIASHAHRPTIYERPAAIISTTAGMGTNEVIKQLKWIELLGFKVVTQKGFMKYPDKKEWRTTKIRKNKQVLNMAKKLDKSIKCSKMRSARFIRVIQFYALKINGMIAPDVYKADYEYYKDKEFFFDAKVGFLKKAMGKMFFNIGTKSLKKKAVF